MSADTDHQRPDWQPPSAPYGQDLYAHGDHPYHEHPELPAYGYGTQAAGHSRLGIASLVMGIIAALTTVAGFVVAGSVSMQHPEIGHLKIEPGQPPLPDELMGPAVAIMSLVCSGVMLALVGLILGLVGISMQGRAKLFAIIGTTLNGLILLSFAALIVIGMRSRG